MAATQVQVDALKAAILSRGGAERIQYGDRSVSYNMKEARLLLSRMEAEVAAATTGAPRRRILRLHQSGNGY